MTPEAYLDRVRALLPALRERAPHAEKLRRLPEETFDDFQQAGLFRCIQPKRWEGYELDPETFYQAIVEVSAICGSSGWILGVVGVHNWHLGLFPPQAQEDVWGEDTGIQISTSLAPTGMVDRVDGGFRIRGRWSFSSGCDYCQWAALGGMAPAVETGASPDARMFLVPRRDYTIDDNWHVTGLCGTGSKDIVVEEAFVPEYRTHSYLDAFHLRNPGAVVNDGPLFRLPFGAVFPNSIAAPAIGVALGALDVFREQSQVRVNLRDGSRLGRQGDPADPACALPVGLGKSRRLEHARRRPPDGGERRARHLSQQPDPARLARHPCDARPYRQQSRTRRRRVRPLRVRAPAGGHTVLEFHQRDTQDVSLRDCCRGIPPAFAI